MDRKSAKPRRKAAGGPRWTPRGQKLTEFILRFLTVYGVLYERGQSLTAPVEQTPPRWQVLGAIEREKLTVSQIARRMGMTRQGVRRIALALRDDGLTREETNPDHKKSPKMALTPKGQLILKQIHGRQAEWVNAAARHFTDSEIEAAISFLNKFEKSI